MREIRQRGCFETQLHEFAVERRIVHVLPGEDNEPRRIESSLRKGGAHAVLLAQVERRCAAPVGLALLSDVRLDLLNNPLNLRVLSVGNRIFFWTIIRNSFSFMLIGSFKM